MFVPRDILPGQQPASTLDELAETQPDADNLILFECMASGDLLEGNSRYGDLEHAAGLPCGDLARRLVAALAPGVESVAATISLDVLDRKRHFHVRFVPVSTHRRNDGKLFATMRETTADFDPGRGKADAVFASTVFADEAPARISSDWYWETSADGRLISISQSLELLVGQPAGGLLGKPLTSIGKLLPGENGEIPIEMAEYRGSSFRNQLMSLETASGTRLYRLAGVAIAERGSSGIGYRGVAVVVPNSSRIIERLRAELGRSAKQQFLSAMSHELRTPLNAIIGFAEAMSHEVHGPLKPQYVDYAGDIASAGRHLLGLIQDLLDISSLDSGEVELDLESFDIAMLVDQARAMIAMKATSAGIDIKGVELSYPAFVRADKRRVLQILVNLLGNAVKFTPQGGMIGCRLAAAENPQEVAITVWDTGPGIDPADHARVFEKFEQLSNQPHLASGEGAGLGLHISRRLAGLMGGSLSLTSRIGEGASFTLTLPAGD